MCDQPERPLPKMCDPCSVEGKKEESTNFCVNCLEYFCINCAKDHRKYKQSRDHIVLEELPSDTSIYESLSTFSRCGFHPEIEIEKYCTIHDAMVCRYCLKDTHNACDDVVDIDDFQKGEIEALPHTLVELKTKYLEHKTTLDMHLEEFDNNNSEVKDNVMAYVQKLREVADRVERSLYETLDSIVSPLQYSLKQSIANLENNVKKVNEFETFHYLIKKHYSKKEKYILVCKVSELVKASGKEQAIVPSVPLQKVTLMTPVNTNELITELSKCDIGFSSAKQLALEKCSDEDTSYGSCYIENKKEDLKTTTSDTMKPFQCTVIELKHDQATQVEKYISDAKLDQGAQVMESDFIKNDKATQYDTSVLDSKLDQCLQVTDTDLLYFGNYPFLEFGFRNSDRTFATQREDDVTVAGPSDIATLDVLFDGRIILIDRSQNIIKLFSPELTLSSLMFLENEPADMCVVEEKEENIFTVAVCFNGGGSLSIIEYAKDFKTQSNIQCIGKTLSVTVHTSDILVLSYEKRGKCKDYAIQVLNPKNGVSRFNFNIPRKMATNSGFKIHMHDLIIIRACSSAKRIILAAKDELYVFDISGYSSIQQRLQNIMQCDWFYKRSGNINLTSVAEVKTDIKGNIYVCDQESGIHQISTKSCRDSRILLTDLKNISSVAIDMKHGRFFIIYENTSFGSIFPLW